MERRHILGKALQVKQRKGHAAIGAIVQRRKNHKMGRKKGLVGKPLDNYNRPIHSLTWKTVRQDWPKLLKVPRDSSFLKRPPKICIPSRAKMNIKRMRRTSRALMDAMELTKLLTRLPMEAQYLESKSWESERIGIGGLAEGHGLLIILGWWMKENPPSDFESPEKSDTSEHGETDRGHELLVDQDKLHDWADHNHKVKPGQTKLNLWWKLASQLITCWTGTPCSRKSQGRTSSATSRRWRGRRRRDWCTPGSRRARGVDRGARWQGRRCWGRRGWRSAKTSTATCRSYGPPDAFYDSTWKKGKHYMLVSVSKGISHFSKLFIRFCHAVCLVCLLGFRVSSVTLAVTVTENIRRMF